MGRHERMSELVYSAEKIEMMKNQIQLYEISFWVCLAGAVFFAALTVFIYFSLDIREVLGRLTGVYKNREIVRIHQNNMLSGKIAGVYGQKKAVVYQYGEEETEKLCPQTEETIPLAADDAVPTSAALDFQIVEDIMEGQPQEWI